MNWLARLKNIDTAPKAAPTETTKRVSVVFVGSDMAPMQKTRGNAPAANDPTPITQDPDRWCWPHNEAMTGREIDTFTARLARFTNKGLGLDGAEALADKLVTRDRELDDRRLCLECSQLSGRGTWRCNQWRRAWLGQPGIPADIVIQLQRCEGFT